MNYVVFDCETTGLSPLSGDRVCEIGAIKIDGEKFLDKFWSLINPEREISYGAYMVNKITSDMIKDAPKIQDVLPRFLQFVGDAKLVAYNAIFDIAFLNNELQRLKFKPLSFKDVIDIYALARKMLPDLERYPLSSVAKNLGVPFATTHRALADAEIAAEVFIKLLRKDASRFLNIANLNYTELIKFLQNAIKERRLVKIRFLNQAKEVLEKDIYPCRIVELKGEDFLEFEFGDKTDSIALMLIEEVL